MRANVVTLLAIVAGMVWLGMQYRNAAWTPMRTAGAAVGVPALAMLIWSRIELGASFAVRPKATALVTTGIYSRIRNPIYVCSSLVVVGLMLFIEKPLGLGILVIVVPLQMYRAKQEAKVLEAKFGEEYRAYRSRTWF